MIKGKFLFSISKSIISDQYDESTAVSSRIHLLFLAGALLLALSPVPLDAANGSGAGSAGSGGRGQLRPVSRTNRNTGDIKSWTGRYSFEDVAGWREQGPGGAVPSVAYSITVSARGGKLFAALEADGFQVSESYACTAEVKGSRLNLYYRSGGGGFDRTASPGLRKGQLLLSLVKTASGKRTRYEFYPAAYEIHTFGTRRKKIYFSRL